MDARGKAEWVGDGGVATGRVYRSGDAVVERVDGLDPVACGVVLESGFVPERVGRFQHLAAGVVGVAAGIAFRVTHVL